MAIINADAFKSCVDELQGNEEWCYGDMARTEMESSYWGIRYGIGATLEEAFKDYLKNSKRVDDEEEELRRNPPPAYPMMEDAMKNVIEVFTKPRDLGNLGLEKMDGPEGNFFYLDYKYEEKDEEGKEG